MLIIFWAIKSIFKFKIF